LLLRDVNDTRVLKNREIGKQEGRSYQSNSLYIEDRSNETAANTMISLIHQTNYLLEQLLRTLEKDFLNKGGFTEKLYKFRRNKKD
jgi:four helix bundle suffix protein